jgi:hypothetical protein
MADFSDGGSVDLYYNHSKKFETTTDGIKVKPNVSLGTIAGNSQDLALFETTNSNASKLRIVEKRDVNGTDWTYAYTRIQKTIDVTDMGYIQFNGSGNGYGMEFGTNADEKFAQFIRNGAVEFYYDNSKKFETTTSGITVTGSVNATSDLYLKENIQPVKSALEIVNQLEGVRFDWKDSGESSLGVIAQDLEKVLPELVSETDGVKSVNYNGIIAVLIQAIKELNQK